MAMVSRRLLNLGRVPVFDISFRKVRYVDGRLDCYSSAWECLHVSFLRVGHASPPHNRDVATTTRKINRVLNNLSRQHRDSTKCARMIITDYGPMLAWTRCREIEEEDAPVEGSIALETHPDEFCRAIGISPDVQKPKAGRWELEPDGWYYCRPKGKGQYKARLVSPDHKSDIFDSQLETTAAEVNELLESCEARNQDPSLELCILLTPAGLLLALVKEDDSDRPSPLGTVTAESDAATIYKALDLRGPSRGPPWVPLLAVAGGLGAAAFIIIAVLVAGDGTSEGQPSPTPSPSGTPAAVLTPTPTIEGTPTAMPLRSPTLLPSPTTTPVETLEPLLTATPLPSETPAPTPSPEATPTAVATETATCTPDGGVPCP